MQWTENAASTHTKALKHFAALTHRHSLQNGNAAMLISMLQFCFLLAKMKHQKMQRKSSGQTICIKKSIFQTIIAVASCCHLSMMTIMLDGNSSSPIYCQSHCMKVYLQCWQLLTFVDSFFIPLAIWFVIFFFWFLQTTLLLLSGNK